MTRSDANPFTPAERDLIRREFCTHSAPAEGADIRVRDVMVSEDALTVALRDGRTIAVPLAWYPRLAGGTPEQRARWELAGGGYGIHWPELDEDLSTEGLLAGARAPRGSAGWRSPLLK